MSWLIVAAIHAAQARDPFVPPEVTRCLREVPSPAEWRLQGVIGRPLDYRGWLLSPLGQVLRVSTSSHFPVAPWRIDEIGPTEIILSEVQSCRPAHYQLQLKGRWDDKKSSHHVVAADLTQSRQGRATFAGFR